MVSYNSQLWATNQQLSPQNFLEAGDSDFWVSVENQVEVATWPGLWFLISFLFLTTASKAIEEDDTD